MRLIGKSKLLKHKRKNRGNTRLSNALDKLIEDLENNNPQNDIELRQLRSGIDKVHNDGFYFIDISVHRSLVLLEFDEVGEATIIWVGSHEEYETTFKNNKSTIKKWLRANDYIK